MIPKIISILLVLKGIAGLILLGDWGIFAVILVMALIFWFWDSIKKISHLAVNYTLLLICIFIIPWVINNKTKRNVLIAGFGIFEKYVAEGMRNKVEYYGLFYKIHKIGIRGMFHDNGETIDSGEDLALAQARDKLMKQRNAQTPFVIFDIGADTGNFTSVVTTVFKNNQIKIFSFEPRKSSFDILTDKYKNNKSVFPQNYGIYDKIDTLRIYYRKDSGRQASIAKMYDKDVIEEKMLLLPIDTIVQRNNIGYIDYLKVDIEGYDYFALQGAKGLISAGKVSYIQFEYGQPNLFSKVVFRDLYKYLSPAYNLYYIGKDGRVPITEYNYKDDVFIQGNYLAELKTLTGKVETKVLENDGY